MSIIERSRPRTGVGTRSSLDHGRESLVASGRRLLGSTAELLGTVAEPSGEIGCDLSALMAGLDVLTAEVMDRLSAGSSGRDGTTLAELGSALVRLQTFRSEVHDHDAHERVDRLAAIDAGLGTLRCIRDPDELLARACGTLVRCAGFGRALLSRVEGATWHPWKSYALHQGPLERAFRQWMATGPEIPLDHLLVESEMVRRHAPALVEHPDTDPRVYRALVEAAGCGPYVAAPIMPTGRVIGFLHADNEPRMVTELDREVLGAFADGFGRLFERAVLLRRLQDQREQVGAALITIENVLEDLANAELELTAHGGEDGAGSRFGDRPAQLSRDPFGLSAGRGSRLASLLTARELEVLELMATGATNCGIAAQLVITDGTVKSHVKRILRKLHAANRSEAVARYLRLTIGASAGGG